MTTPLLMLNGVSGISTNPQHPQILVPGDISKQRFSEIIHDLSIKMNTSSFVPGSQESVHYYDSITRLLGGLNQLLLLHYLQDLTSFGPRVTGTTACRNAGIYLYHEFQDMGLEVRYQNYTYNSQIVSNIEATLPGIDPLSDEIVIICGHYDTVTLSPGADDDASGVAVALAAAYVMRNYEFNHTIRFVAFSGEEQGLLGSAEYAEEAYQRGDNIVAVLNADMIGFAETFPDEMLIKIYFDDQSEWLLNYTTSISQVYRGSIGLTIVPSGFTWGSDHYSFWQNGYSAVFYHENFFNTYYHSNQDTIAHMNLRYTTKGSILILATCASLAELQSSVHVFTVTEFSLI